MNQDIYVVIEHLAGKVFDISFVMLAAARDLADQSQGRVIAVLLCHQSKDLGENLAADKILFVDHPAVAEYNPQAYLGVLETLLADKLPRAVLFGSTTMGTDLAEVLSVRLDLPLISACMRFEAQGRALSQICGGKIMVENTLPEKTTLLTFIPGGYKTEAGHSQTGPEMAALPSPALDDLRISLRGYLEPEVGDVDITRADVLVAIGRGIQNEDNIELAHELAARIGATVCVTRPIADQGWLPASRVVGKSGKKVHPKVYLAFGISGAPEHVEGMDESEIMVAINTDPGAPIFGIAHYGAQVDMLDLMEELAARLATSQPVP
jgi:electron transfer flavoprotein alpha subunit